MAYGLDATFAKDATIIILTSPPQCDAQLVSHFLPEGAFLSHRNYLMTGMFLKPTDSEHQEESESLIRSKAVATRENESEVREQIAEAQRGGESSHCIFSLEHTDLTPPSHRRQPPSCSRWHDKHTPSAYGSTSDFWCLSGYKSAKCPTSPPLSRT